MKQMIIILIVALSASSALAAGRTAQEICSIAADNARTIMYNRQSHVPKSVVMSYSEGNNISEYMIHRAYEQPMHSTEKEIPEIIEKFVNKMRKECYEAQR